MPSSEASATDHTREPSSQNQGNLDDLLLRLGIDEDEIDDLVFEDEEEAPKQGLKWTALARVHTTNNFSSQRSSSLPLKIRFFRSNAHVWETGLKLNREVPGSSVRTLCPLNPMMAWRRRTPLI
jgi:hypothetical protein